MSSSQSNGQQMASSTPHPSEDAIAFNTRAAVALRHSQPSSSPPHVSTTVPLPGTQQLSPDHSTSLHNSTDSITHTEQRDLNDYHDNHMTPVAGHTSHQEISVVHPNDMTNLQQQQIKHLYHHLLHMKYLNQPLLLHHLVVQLHLLFHQIMTATMFIPTQHQ